MARQGPPIQTFSLNAVARKGFTGALIVFLFLFLSLSSHAQKRFDWRTHADLLIQYADSLALHHQRTFYLTKYQRSDQPYKETWYYTVREGKVLEFEIRYLVDSVEFSETYYLDNGRPVCMERYETVYFGFHEDEIKRGEVLFFQKEDLMQYVTIGHQDDRYGRYNQAWDSMKRFSDRYAELKRNIVATGQFRNN